MLPPKTAVMIHIHLSVKRAEANPGKESPGIYYTMQTKQWLISYHTEHFASSEIERSRKKKVCAVKQRASTVIALWSKSGRETKNRPGSTFWPYVVCQHLGVCEFSLTRLGDGCVTAGQAGCMSCSQISDNLRGLLRKEVGFMGWGGGESWGRRRLEERGCASCNGPDLKLETDLSWWSSPCVFFFIDSPDMQSHNSAEWTETERLAGYSREVDIV